MSNKMPGYDTFGPQYPPEWDKVVMETCTICGAEEPDEVMTSDNDGNIFCPKCQGEKEDAFEYHYKAVFFDEGGMFLDREHFSIWSTDRDEARCEADELAEEYAENIDAYGFDLTLEDVTG